MDRDPRRRPEYNTENPEDKAEYRAFGERLVVKHGPECLREGMRAFEDDRQNWMKARQGELEEHIPSSRKKLTGFMSSSTATPRATRTRTGALYPAPNRTRSWTSKNNLRK